MSNGNPADFRVEIVKGRPQGIRGIQITDSGFGIDLIFEKNLDPPGEVVDVTDAATLEDLGSINRAVERDLLSFKTGDATLSFINDDGFFTDLFNEAVFTPKTMWSLRILRRGVTQFWGLIYGVGAIRFDDFERMVEVTAYGLTKLLDLTDAGIVRRAFIHTVVVTATGGATTLTLNGTDILVAGDVLHLTDHAKSEDVTIKQVTSGSVVSLEAPLQNTYAAGSPVTISTPFYRYKTIEFLARQLFKAAFVPLADLRLSQSQFNRLAPTPVNLTGLNLALSQRGAPCERNGRTYVTLAGGNTYYQDAPDDPWTQEDATAQEWIDWSRYYSETETPPSTILRGLAAGASVCESHSCGYDYKSGTKVIYMMDPDTTYGPSGLIKFSSADGVSWGAQTLVSVPPVANGAAAEILTTEYDPVRNACYCAWRSVGAPGTAQPYFYDIGGATWTSLRQAGDDAETGYWGFVYVPSKDYVLALRGKQIQSGVIPTRVFSEIAAFRGTTLLWVRPFPSCLISNEGHTVRPIIPTSTLREVAGSLYCLCVSDGAVQLVRSDDEFQTFTMRKVQPATANQRIFAARVKGQYRSFSYKGALPTGYMVAAPFYAGVIPYADFEGLSSAEGLKKLSVLSNAVFWVDDDLQGHFVARDLFDPDAVLDVTDRILERNDTLIWEETAQFAKVSGNSIEAVAGDENFTAEGIELESSLIPNEAFAQALADSYYRFYSPQRAFFDGTMMDEDGTIYRPLDRLLIDGQRYLVYESDHELADDEVSVSLLQDR